MILCFHDIGANIIIKTIQSDTPLTLSKIIIYEVENMLLLHINKKKK